MLVTENVTIVHGPPPDPLPQPPFVVDEPASPELRLLGYERGPLAAETGEPVALALWWLAAEPLPHMTVNLSLLNETTGENRAFGTIQPFYNLYPFATWTTPAFVIDRQIVRIPDDLPSGDYRLRLELAGNSQETLYTADLGPLAVSRTARVFEPPMLEYRLDALFGEEIALLGYNLPAGEGDRLLELVWQAAAQPTTDYTVFVHVLNPDGICCVWQSDAMPRGGTYPTSRWRPGEVVTDPYEIALPEGLATGDYEIEVGLYVAEMGERLPVTSGKARENVVRLQPLKVSD